MNPLHVELGLFGLLAIVGGTSFNWLFDHPQVPVIRFRSPAEFQRLSMADFDDIEEEGFKAGHVFAALGVVCVVASGALMVWPKEKPVPVPAVVINPAAPALTRSVPVRQP